MLFICLCFFMLTFMATVGVHLVQFFPSVTFQNGNMDLRMSPEAIFTKQCVGKASILGELSLCKMEDIIGILCPPERVFFLNASRKIYCNLCTGFCTGFHSSSYLKCQKVRHCPFRVQSVSLQLPPRTAF